MNIALVHNRYAADSGEETAVENLLSLLVARGHKVVCFMRSSADIRARFLGRSRAFFSGIFSLSSKFAFRDFLNETRPDVVHIHNVFPLISPSVLLECRRARVPVVMSVHNYRLVCPNGLHMSKRDARLCEKCCGGHEYWCFLKNCEGSAVKSLGYALRSLIARKARWYRANVSVYACLTDFQRRRLIAEGYPQDRMAVIPNMVRPTNGCGDVPLGDYVGFAGRVSPEKGIDVFISAARKCPEIRFLVAGNYDRMPGILQRTPPNCTLLGHLGPAELARFYASSRMVVVPSVWYEAFGLCAAEAQVQGKAVVCSRIGALPEIVAGGASGLLFEPGNADDLAGKIRYLWDSPDLCRQMGATGRQKALHEYSPDTYYERITAAYEKAIRLGSPPWKCQP
jgi:glycosyltransferase involved in cell wall biosynthesis